MHRHIEPDPGRHHDLERQVANNRGAHCEIDVAVKDDLPRRDEGVVEPGDLLVSHVGAGTVGILHLRVGGEHADPTGAVVCIGGRRRALDHRQEFGVYRCHLGAGRQHKLAHLRRIGLTLRRLHHRSDDGTGSLNFSAADLFCHIGIGGQRFVHGRLDQ